MSCTLTSLNLSFSYSVDSQAASAEPVAQVGSVAAQVSAVGSGDAMDEYEYEEVLEEVEVEVDDDEDLIGGVAEGGYGEGVIYTGASV